MNRLLLIAGVMAMWAAPVLSHEDVRSQNLTVDSAHIQSLLRQVDDVRRELLLLLETAPVQQDTQQHLSTIRPRPRPTNLTVNNDSSAD